MTIAPPRPTGVVPMAPAKAGKRPRSKDQWSLPTATLMVGLGSALTMLPLHTVFTDTVWITTGLVAAAPFWAFTALMRTRTNAAWIPFAGLLASLLMVLWIFAPTHLGFGVVPTPAAWRELNDLLVIAGNQIRNEHAPLASTHELRIITTIAFVVIVMLADVLVILLRNPLLAGAPLLEVLAVSSAIASKPSNPILFALAATGFLLILLTGTRLQDREWGPSVDGSSGRMGGARRIGAVGIVAALLVPVVLPRVSGDLLSRATHRGGEGGSVGAGGGRIVLNDLASLRGSLTRNTPVELFQMRVPRGQNPYYVRTNVLDTFSNDGWRPGARHQAASVPLRANQFPLNSDGDASTSAPTGTSLRIQIDISALGGDQLPVVSRPASLSNVPNGVWWPDTGTAELSRGLPESLRYFQDVFQATPSSAELKAAPAWVSSGSAADNALIALPAQPAEVSALVTSLTKGLTNNYEKALAISDYFRASANGFTYSLDVPPAGGQSAIVSFLTNKRGFCQQFSAAAAVMMRVAGIPARVVVGYNHAPPDASGAIRVTTADAHAWVEALFPTVGWVPFDPTPLGGVDAGRAIDLPWSPEPTAAPSQNGNERDRPSASARPGGSASDSATDVATAVGTSGGTPLGMIGAVLGVLVVLVLIGAGPPTVRGSLRRRRLALAGTRGDPELLWEEVAATAQDQGALWPDTVTVGQVPAWLGSRGLDERGRSTLGEVAMGVELRRYSSHRDAGIHPELIANLSEALRRWERRDGRKRRVFARWVPMSLRSRRQSRLR